LLNIIVIIEGLLCAVWAVHAFGLK